MYGVAHTHGMGFIILQVHITHMGCNSVMARIVATGYKVDKAHTGDMGFSEVVVRIIFLGYKC